jgi:hypothetical protein
MTASNARGADPLTVTDSSRQTLVRVLRVAFPHQTFPDGPYERTAAKIVEAAGQSTWSTLQLTQGLTSLDSLSGRAFADLGADEALKVLQQVEGTEFFGLIRRTAVVSLYDDPEVWEALGYEGSSFEKGGYIDRGFDDLDWLPSPRIEEYSGRETLVEVTPGTVSSGGPDRPLATAGPDTSVAAASHPGVAPQQAQDVVTKEDV